jgi:hypothetical protein
VKLRNQLYAPKWEREEEEKLDTGQFQLASLCADKALAEQSYGYSKLHASYSFSESAILRILSSNEILV